MLSINAPINCIYYEEHDSYTRNKFTWNTNGDTVSHKPAPTCQFAVSNKTLYRQAWREIN